MAQAWFIEQSTIRLDLHVPERCENPLSKKCAECWNIDLFLGTCTVLAENWGEQFVGSITAYGMYFSFLILPLGFIVRRSAVIWAGFTPLWGIMVAAILQSTIPNPRPIGACAGFWGNSCGMPSGHVTTSYCTLSFLMLMFVRAVRSKGPLSNRLRDVDCKQPKYIIGYLVLAIFLLVQMLMPLGRIYLHYHTPAQTGFGVLTGMAIGIMWFSIVLTFLGPRIGPWLETSFNVVNFRDDWTEQGKQQYELFTQRSENDLGTV
jgi:membrane-associated phospholipid phosphatase